MRPAVATANPHLVASRAARPVPAHVSSLARLLAGIQWDERDGFREDPALRAQAQAQMPIAEQRMQAVFERGLGDTRMLRWGNQLRIAEGTDGMRWNTNLTLFNALSATQAVALRGAIRGETGRDVDPIEYQVPLRARGRRGVRDVVRPSSARAPPVDAGQPLHGSTTWRPG